MFRWFYTQTVVYDGNEYQNVFNKFSADNTTLWRRQTWYIIYDKFSNFVILLSDPQYKDNKATIKKKKNYNNQI